MQCLTNFKDKTEYSNHYLNLNADKVKQYEAVGKPWLRYTKTNRLFRFYASNSLWLTCMLPKTGFIYVASSCKLPPSQKVEN